MKIWIVEAGHSYEGGSIVGVRSSEELAKKLCDKYKEAGGYDWVHMTDYVIDDGVPDYSHFT